MVAAEAQQEVLSEWGIEKINGIKTDTGWRLTTILAVIKDVINIEHGALYSSQD